MAEDASSGVSETANPAAVALALADASRVKADAAGKKGEARTHFAHTGTLELTSSEKSKLEPSSRLIAA
jgi:hypothetical protein